MAQRSFRISAVAALVLLASALGPAQAKYRYGRYGGGGGERGFFLLVEGGLANPRNTDAVLATVESVADFGGGVNELTPVLPNWDDEFAGRLAVGYAWSGGNRVSFGVWGFNAEQSASGDGPASGRLHFAVGPPIFTGGDYVGDNASPGSFSLTTEVEAATADLAWTHAEELSEALTLEWSLGLRYADYKETTEGFYDEVDFSSIDFGAEQYDARKSNEGQMLGVRAAVRGSYRVAQRISLGAGLGFSFLDGKLDASSSLAPAAGSLLSSTPAAVATVSDDGRSGRIRDLEVAVTWHSTADALRISLGWEQSTWEEIASDLVRNFPGTSAPLRERDGVTFSGYKVGVFLRF